VAVGKTVAVDDGVTEGLGEAVAVGADVSNCTTSVGRWLVALLSRDVNLMRSLDRAIRFKVNVPFAPISGVTSNSATDPEVDCREDTTS